MVRSEKEAVVGALADVFSSANGIYLTDFTGMDVTSLTELRRQLKASSASYRIVKNTLARLALDRSGKETLKEFFQGPTGVAVTFEDEVVPAKVLVDFAKETERPKLKGAFIEGRLFTPEEVTALAALPSKNELLVGVVRGIQTPLSGLVGCLSGMFRNLAGVLRAVAECKGREAG
ncbi:MAG TPA: 50S ribosomal protein L10 [Candidatus Latescibacteria bacterium]|nr:50S ribosomal protein L10 [Candidatus Latescibacterota bacterium]